MVGRKPPRGYADMQTHGAGELKCNIFRLIARLRARLCRTLKFRHLRLSTLDDRISIRGVSDCRVCDTPRTFCQSGLLLRYPMLEIDAVARGNAEQVGGAPDHIVLEFADLAVGIDQLPHHLDDAQASLLIHTAHDDAGEVIEIDRLAFDPCRRRDQLVRGAGIELEAAFDQAVKLALLDRGRLAVERDDMDQECGCGQTIVGIVEGTIAVRVGRDNVGNELAKSVKHQGLYRWRSDSRYMAWNISRRNRCGSDDCINSRQSLPWERHCERSNPCRIPKKEWMLRRLCSSQ